MTITSVGNTSSLTITNVQLGDAAIYTVETTGACSTASQSAMLSINSTPPGIVLNGNNIQLWPPNHSYHTINVTDLVAGASSCDGTVNLSSVVIDYVTSDEVENGNGATANTLNDIVIGRDRKSVQLRAEPRWQRQWPCFTRSTSKSPTASGMWERRRPSSLCRRTKTVRPRRLIAEGITR